MPGLQSNSEAASYDWAMMEALEQVCNTSEQSYEQFLSTFTNLTTENLIRLHLNVSKGDTSSCLGEMNRAQTACWKRWMRENLRPEDRCILEGSVTGGRPGNVETFPSDQPVEFDNYLDDMEPEENLLNADQDVCVLPGEVEEDLPGYIPSFCHCTLLELSSSATDHRTHSPQTIAAQCQNQNEDVVPFTLDDFDYDCVVLSHKHPIQNSFRGTS